MCVCVCMCVYVYVCICVSVIKHRRYCFFFFVVHMNRHTLCINTTYYSNRGCPMRRATLPSSWEEVFMTRIEFPAVSAHKTSWQSEESLLFVASRNGTMFSDVYYAQIRTRTKSLSQSTSKEERVCMFAYKRSVSSGCKCTCVCECVCRCVCVRACVHARERSRVCMRVCLCACMFTFGRR